MPARIKTTVVGSYPVPSWLVGNTSRLVLRDAVMAVLKTQELAGIDLVTDGELMRFDPSHPETNGMVDYFASRMDGIRKHFSLSDFDRFRSDHASGYRLLTAGMVVSKIQDGTLNLPSDYDFARPLTKLPFKFTCTGPHMLARVLTNCFYKNIADLAMDIAVWELWWTASASRLLARFVTVPESVAHRPSGAGVRTPRLRGAVGFRRPECRYPARRGISGYQGQRGREPGANRQANRARRKSIGTRAPCVCPSRLRILDAAAQRRRSQDAQSGTRQRFVRGAGVAAQPRPGRT